MKFRTIILAFLLALWVLTFFSSCRLSKQERRLKRDSQLIGKIQARSPELFVVKSDTVKTVDSLNIGLSPEVDTAGVRELLDQYLAAEKAKTENHFNKEIDLIQKELRAQTLIAYQKDLQLKIARAGLKPIQQTFKNDNYNFTVFFDPRKEQAISINGEVYSKVIHTQTTITHKEFIYKKPTTKQALMKLWPWWTGGTVALIAYIAFKILTR